MLLFKTLQGPAYHPLIADPATIKAGKPIHLYLLSPLHPIWSALIAAAAVFLTAVGANVFFRGGVEARDVAMVFGPFFLLALTRFLIFRRTALVDVSRLEVCGRANPIFSIEWLVWLIGIAVLVFLFGSVSDGATLWATRASAMLIVVVAMLPLMQDARSRLSDRLG